VRDDQMPTRRRVTGVLRHNGDHEPRQFRVEAGHKVWRYDCAGHQLVVQNGRLNLAHLFGPLGRKCFILSVQCPLGGNAVPILRCGS
jgi:hypothetical protein